MSDLTIYEEIQLERQKQDKEWGGPMHDDNHNPHDWITYIVKHLGKSITWPFNMDTFRYQMIRVAALAVAAIEWTDRLE
jgi:hypothetical protein